MACGSSAVGSGLGPGNRTDTDESIIVSIGDFVEVEIGATGAFGGQSLEVRNVTMRWNNITHVKKNNAINSKVNS